MPRRALTAAAVDRIKPPSKGQVDHFDKGFPGLALRVSYAGGKSWVFFYRIGGRLRRMTLGTYPALTLADARETWREARRDAAVGRDPAQARKRGKSGHDFETVARDWLRRDQSKNKSKREVERVLERELIPAWGHRGVQVYMTYLSLYVDGTKDRQLIRKRRSENEAKDLDDLTQEYGDYDEQLVSEVLQGKRKSPYFESLVCRIASRRIAASNDARLPPNLRAYVCSVLEREAARHQERRGKKEDPRNCSITNCVNILLDCLPPLRRTRNEATKAAVVSACSIVSQALKKGGLLDISEKQVNEIWTAQKQRAQRAAEEWRRENKLRSGKS